jgi:hypothetical protein
MTHVKLEILPGEQEESDSLCDSLCVVAPRACGRRRDPHNTYLGHFDVLSYDVYRFGQICSVMYLAEVSNTRVG